MEKENADVLRLVSELQEAVTRLTQAQGRAYKLWVEALRAAGAAAGTGPKQS